MKKENNIIRKSIIEIVLAFTLVLISIPIWNNESINAYALTASHYDNYKAVYLTKDTQDNNKLYVVNYNDKKTNYILYIRVDNYFNLDKIAINIDDVYYSLSELEVINDNGSYLVKLDENVINTNEKKEYSYNIITTSDVDDDLKYEINKLI